MKSKVLAALVATMAVGATCAFAANPFVDVPSDSWAYKSVVELADAGIIQGVDGSYFQGERNITRYEAAEMTAKAMAHMDKASVEQRALINKLADEYADELNNLGVRVSNLENRVGNVKLTGDARIRYIHQGNSSKDGVTNKDGVKNDNSWTYRVRLRANANVNDRTTVTYGMSTDNVSFGDNNTAQDGNGDVFTDTAKVDYNFGGNNWNLSVGRENTYVLGNAYGYNYGNVFDRAELKYTNDRFRATAGYGKFKANGYAKNLAGNDDYDIDGVKTGYGELEGFFSNGSAVGVYYNSFSRAGGSYKGDQDRFNADDLWGAYASVNFGQKWNLLANYEHVSLNDNFKNKDNDDSANVWIGKLTYGKAAFSTPKSWDAWVEYINADDGALVGASNSWRNNNLLNNVKSWGVGADYTLAKNAQFQVMQSFASSAKTGKSVADPEEETRAQFVFVF
jgi:hypothetical protein